MPERDTPIRDRVVAATREGELAVLQGLLAELQTSSDADSAIITFVQAEILRQTRDIDAALEELRKAEEEFASAGDQLLLAECLRKQAACHWILQHQMDAEPLILRALEIHQTLNDRHGMGLDRLGLGSIYHAQSDMTAAYPHLMQAANLFEEVGDQRSLAGALGDIASIYSLTGQFEQAQAYYHRALDEAVSLGAKDLELSIRYNLATMHFQIGEVPRARSEYERIVDIARAEGNAYREQQSTLSQVHCDLSNEEGEEDAASAERRLRAFLEQDLDPFFQSGYKLTAHLARGVRGASEPF